MAGQLQFKWSLKDTDNFSSVRPISKTFSVSYTQKVQWEDSLADTEFVTVWDVNNTTSAATDFDFLIAHCSGGDCDLELSTNTDDAATDAAQFYTLRLTTSAPLVLGADDSMADHSTGGAISIASASLDTIDRIRAVNPDSSKTVAISIVIAT